MKPGLAVGLVALLSGCGGANDAASSNAPPPEVSTADVHRFVAALHRLTPVDSDCTALDGFVRAASRGQNAYFDKFGVRWSDICRALRRSPDWYTALEVLEA